MPRDQPAAAVAELEDRLLDAGPVGPTGQVQHGRRHALHPATDDAGEPLAAQHHGQHEHRRHQHGQSEDRRAHQLLAGLAFGHQQHQRDHRQTELEEDVPDARHQDAEGGLRHPEPPGPAHAVGGADTHGATEGHDVRHGAAGRVQHEALGVAQPGQRRGEHAGVHDEPDQPHHRQQPDLGDAQVVELVGDAAVGGARHLGDDQREQQDQGRERHERLGDATLGRLAVQLVLDRERGVGGLDRVVEVERGDVGPVVVRGHGRDDRFEASGRIDRHARETSEANTSSAGWPAGRPGSTYHSVPKARAKYSSGRPRKRSRLRVPDGSAAVAWLA